MASIDVEVEMVGTSDSVAMPIRQISVSAVLRGVGSSGPATQSESLEPQPEPENPE